MKETCSPFSRSQQRSKSDKGFALIGSGSIYGKSECWDLCIPHLGRWDGVLTLHLGISRDPSCSLLPSLKVGWDQISWEVGLGSWKTDKFLQCSFLFAICPKGCLIDIKKNPFSTATVLLEQIKDLSEEYSDYLLLLFGFEQRTFNPPLFTACHGNKWRA